jgi:exodeoxyribonuclease-3
MTRARATSFSVASWNVNSLRLRLPLVLAYLDAQRPDVLCIQETKTADAAFPHAAFGERGYEVATAGSGGYAGVAIASRAPIGESVSGISAFVEERAPGRRLLCRIGSRFVDCVYVPTRTKIGKAEFLDALRADHDARFDAAAEVVLAGDFNICFDERDYASPRMIAGADVHPRRPEDLAFRRLLDGRFVDCLRRLDSTKGPFSWYPNATWALKRSYGMRLDYVFATPALAERVAEVVHDRARRADPSPSDHVPVFARFDPSS